MLSNDSYAAIHRTVHMEYPEAASLPLPTNLQCLLNDVGRFSPQRTRDINGTVIVSQLPDRVSLVLQMHSPAVFDPRLASFDCSGAVSLNSSMQSNVPSPFSSKGKSMHLNMPGGQWEQQNKFIAGDMQKMHFTNTVQKKKGIRMFHSITQRTKINSFMGRCESNKSSNPDEKPLSRVDRLKQTIKEYGSTVIVFHVGISLVSLGTCYVVVSRFVILHVTYYFRLPLFLNMRAPLRTL